MAANKGGLLKIVYCSFFLPLIEMNSMERAATRDMAVPRTNTAVKKYGWKKLKMKIRESFYGARAFYILTII